MNANFQVDYQYIEVEYVCPYDGGTARAFRVELNMRLRNGAWTTRKAVIPVPWDAPWCVVGHMAHKIMCMSPKKLFPWRAQADEDTEVYQKNSGEVIYNSSLRDEALAWEETAPKNSSVLTYWSRVDRR